VKKYIIALSLLLVGCATLSHHEYAQYGYDRVAKVRIVLVADNYKGVLGSGTILGRKGYVLTAAHVTRIAEKDPCNIAIKTGEEEVESCVVAKTDKARDLALLYCEGLKGHEGITRVAKKSPRLGDFIFTVAGPIGLPLVYTEGHVSLLNEAKGKFWINLLSGPGASGGGMFNEDKELVGVIQMGISGPFDLFGHLVIAANPLQIRRFLEDVEWK